MQHEKKPELLVDSFLWLSGVCIEIMNDMKINKGGLRLENMELFKEIIKFY
jgi:hypothetical protein